MTESSLAIRLRNHWLTDGADAGLRSSHGALVDMALSGPPTGGGMTGETATNRALRGLERSREHSTLERALACLSPLHRAALWLAYGPHEWPTEAKRLFKSMGTDLGVVLLAPTAVSGWRAELERRQPSNPRAALRLRDLGPGEWLRLRAAQTARGQVVEEARELLKSARSALTRQLFNIGDPRALHDEQEQRDRPKRRDRVRVHHNVDFLVRL